MRRIITLACLLSAFLFTAARTPAEGNGFKPIFDGKTLTGWDGNPRLWRVEDGAIVGETTADKRTKKNTLLIWRGGRPGDFVLKLRFILTNHNSGVQYRSREEPEKWGRWVLRGYQADIAAKNTPHTGIFYEEGGRGILAKRGERIVIGDDHKPRVLGKTGEFDELTATLRPDDWNDYEIVAKGNHLKHIINGRVMSNVIDNDAKKRSMSGLLGFQLHAGPPMKVQFRDIRIKTLPAGKSENSGAAKKKIAFIAGPASHGYGEHEHRGGCLLLAECMKAAYPNVEIAVFEGRWPKDRKALDDADAIVIYSDGSKSHPMLRHLQQMERLMKRGVGLACIHFAVTAPMNKGGEQMKQWIGANYELHWTVNPIWTAEFKKFPNHPVARGLKPFATEDEWYFNMRFIDGMDGVTPILTAVPPDAARDGPDGPSSGNPTVRSRKGKAEHVAWARQRPDGGRGFGTTGGHWHWNWANDNFRKTVLNGIAWVAKLDIPQDGVPSKTPTLDYLIGGIDQPKPADFDREEIRKRIKSWN